jgi:hypothetical protein
LTASSSILVFTIPETPPDPTITDFDTGDEERPAKRDQTWALTRNELLNQLLQTSTDLPFNTGVTKNHGHCRRPFLYQLAGRGSIIAQAPRRTHHCRRRCLRWQIGTIRHRQSRRCLTLRRSLLPRHTARRLLQCT